MSCNDSRKEFHDSHEEFISHSGYTHISTYEADTSHNSNKEFYNFQQEFITTSEHSSKLHYDEAITCISSDIKLTDYNEITTSDLKLPSQNRMILTWEFDSQEEFVRATHSAVSCEGQGETYDSKMEFEHCSISTSKR